MSITKGAMLISNANAVGTELVNQLGGTGYKPVEWADKINLLGIRDDDKASALAGITSGTYTGDERGAIHYSNCNAVGAMLNKKFSTDRGFKPVEWESAISKLTPLVEGTVSGDICTIVNGADDVPCKNVVVTIPPTLSGVSEVTETQTGRNLFDISTATNGQINGTNGVYYANANWQASDFFPVHGANLTLSWDTDSSNYYQVNLAFYDSEKHYVDGSNNTFANIYSKTFTIPSGAVYCRASWSIYVGGSPAPRNNIRINLGSTDGGYTPYTSPTQYTAQLGRTIYGGQADIVNGNCEPTNWIDDTLSNLEQGSINGSTGANENANNRVRNASAIPFPYDEIASSYTWTIPSGYKVAIRPYDANGNFIQLPSWALAFITQLPQDLIGQGITQMRFFLAKTDNSAITPSDMAEVGYILNKGNTADAYSPYFAPFTFDGQEVPTRLGVNNFWSDSGDTEVTYRKDPDIPDPPVQLLNMNNENNENNENNDH